MKSYIAAFQNSAKFLATTIEADDAVAKFVFNKLTTDPEWNNRVHLGMDKDYIETHRESFIEDHGRDAVDDDELVYDLWKVYVSEFFEFFPSAVPLILGWIAEAAGLKDEF
jgi:hypothetical protein